MSFATSAVRTCGTEVGRQKARAKIADGAAYRTIDSIILENHHLLQGTTLSSLRVGINIAAMRARSWIGHRQLLQITSGTLLTRKHQPTRLDRARTIAVVSTTTQTLLSGTAAVTSRRLARKSTPTTSTVTMTRLAGATLHTTTLLAVHHRLPRPQTV